MGLAVVGLLVCMGMLAYLGAWASKQCDAKPNAFTNLFAPEMNKRCNLVGKMENDRAQ